MIIDRRRAWTNSALFLGFIAALPGQALALTSVQPEVLRPYFLDETVQRFDAYLWPGYAMSIAEDVISLAFFAALLAFALNDALMRRCLGLAAALGRRLTWPGARRIGGVLTRMWGDETWAAALLFVAIYLLIERLLFFPGALYFNWFREHQYGYSVQPLASFLWDWAKGLFFSALTMSALAFGLFGLARRTRRWWLVLGIPCSVLMLGAGFLDPYKAQLYRDYESLPEGPVREAIAQTLGKAGVEYEDVMVLKMREVSTRVNAFIAGVGPSRRIVLYDTFIAAMTPDEIANAVAHELGHLRDRSFARTALSALLLTPLLWLIASLLRALGRRKKLGFTDDRDVRALPAIMAFLFVLSALQAPLSNAHSRMLERRADDYALELLGQPEAFRSMMVKLALINAADLHPPLWMQVQWKSHPLVIERIQRAEAFAAARGIELTVPTPQLFALPADFQAQLTARAQAIQRAGAGK